MAYFKIGPNAKVIPESNGPATFANLHQGSFDVQATLHALYRARGAHSLYTSGSNLQSFIQDKKERQPLEPPKKGFS